MNPKITYAVAAILAGASCAAASTARAADAKTTATETNSEGLVEITVTAERRSQSMQDVPISMQAFTAQTLEQLNVRPWTTTSSTCPTSPPPTMGRVRTRSSCAA